MKRFGLITVAVILLAGMFGWQSTAQSANAPGVPNILVLPFTATNNPGANDWIGKGIQQSLLADLSGRSGVAVTFATAQPAQAGQVAAEPADSLALAARAGASVVVVGTYQVNNNQLRITGVLYDVASAKDIGGIKATGAITDLFALEDSLNDQIGHVLSLAPAVVNVPPQPQQQVVQAPATPATADDSSTIIPTTALIAAPQTSQYVYVYPNTSYCYTPSYYPYYSSPVYGYGYGYVGFSPVIRFGGFSRGFIGGGFGGFHGGGGFRGGFGGGFHGGGGRR
jgi:TolB-like protein